MEIESKEKQEINGMRMMMQVMVAHAMFEWQKMPSMSFETILSAIYQAHIGEDLHEQYLAFDMINSVRSDLMAQIFVLMNEIFKEDLMSEKIKQLKIDAVIDGEKKSVSYYYLLKGIRNSFAHNDDNGNLVWSNDNHSQNFYIKIKGKDGEQKEIKIHANDLSQLISTYAEEGGLEKVTGLIECNDMIFTEIDKKSLSDKNIHRYIRQMALLNPSNPIPPDQYQKRTLRYLVNSLSNYYRLFKYTMRDENSGQLFLQAGCVSHCYPFKNNASNIFDNLVFTSVALSILSENPNQNLSDFQKNAHQELISIFEDTAGISPYSFAFLMNGKLLVSSLFSNIAFKIFSTSFKDPQQSDLDKLKKYYKKEINITKVRNGIMHGRFFYNFDHGFEIYDTKSKEDGSELIHVATLDFEDIDLASQTLLVDKIVKEDLNKHS